MAHLGSRPSDSGSVIDLSQLPSPSHSGSYHLDHSYSALPPLGNNYIITFNNVNQKVLTLLQLQQTVAALVQRPETQNVWVTAEILDVAVRGGHCYMELLQKDERGLQVAKARAALRETGAPTFCLGGGVAANPTLRAAYEQMCAEEGVRLVMPPLASCGDNAGMIAEVALDRYRAGAFSPLSTDALAHGDLEVPY